jgi:hypothetical protein
MGKMTLQNIDIKIDQHLIDHKEKGGYDEMIRQVRDTVYGKNLDDGLCADVKEVKKGYAKMMGIEIAILITLLANLILPRILK